MTKTDSHPSLMQLRWFRTLVWTLALFVGILFVLPLLYELFLVVTPAMDASTERSTRRILGATANIFSWVVLVLGLLLAWSQRQTHIKREKLHKRVIERRRERKREALEAQRQKLYGKKTKAQK
jgi:hypothetical protein